MTIENVKPKLDRRHFLKIGATMGAGVFLTPYPAVAGSTPVAVTPATPALTPAPEQESQFSVVVPLHAWAVYGELFTQFKAMYPAITIWAVIA